MADRRFRAPCVILNPRAASGKAQRKWRSLRPVLRRELGQFDRLVTEGPNHATELAQDAIRGGADLVVAMGGDGTLSEVVNGYFADGRPIAPETAVGLCPIGTGGDFRRASGIPTDPSGAIANIAHGATSRVDVLRLDLAGSGGRQIRRYCINVSSFGLGGEVSVAAKASFLAPYSGRAAFLWATALGFVRFRAKSVRLSLDGSDYAEPVRIMQVALGNGNCHGGGMLVCPRASFDSGAFDVTVIRKIGMLNFLLSLPRLYSGTILGHPRCEHYRVERLAAQSDERVSVEVDGEAVGHLPLSATILPSAVRIAGASITN